MIDIHCHILPKVDDGSKSWDMSLEMCRMAADDGIEHIVATPHANERYEYNATFIFLTITCGKFWLRRNASPSKIPTTCWWS